MLILHSTLILILQLPQTYFFSEVCYYHTFIHHENLRIILSSSKKKRNKLGFDWYCVQFINWPFSSIMNSYLQKQSTLSSLFMFFRKVLWLSSYRFYLLLAYFQVFYPTCSCYQWDYVSVVGKHADTCSYTNIYFVSSHSWNCF